MRAPEERNNRLVGTLRRPLGVHERPDCADHHFARHACLFRPVSVSTHDRFSEGAVKRAKVDPASLCGRSHIHATPYALTHLIVQFAPSHPLLGSQSPREVFCRVVIGSAKLCQWVDIFVDWGCVQLLDTCPNPHL